MKQNFLLSYLKELSKLWRIVAILLYTLGYGVIQDFGLCKVDISCNLSMWTQSGVQSQKIEYLSQLFLYKTETYSYYTRHKVPWYVLCDISMPTQWTPGPLHSKGKISIFLLQDVLFALVVHSDGVSESKMDITNHKHKRVCLTKAVFVLGM